MKWKTAWLVILGASIMAIKIEWTNSTVVAIMALDVFVFTEMVHGGSWKNIFNEMTLVTIKMNDKKRQKEMHCLFNRGYFHFMIKFDLEFELHYCTSHYILSEADGSCPSIKVSKSIVFKHHNSLTLHFLFSFFQSNRTIFGILTHKR